MKALKSILYQVSIDLVLKSMWTCSYPKLRTWNKVKIKTEVMALQACGSFSKPKKTFQNTKAVLMLVSLNARDYYYLSLMLLHSDSVS